MEEFGGGGLGDVDGHSLGGEGKVNGGGVDAPGGTERALRRVVRVGDGSFTATTCKIELCSRVNEIIILLISFYS